MPTATQVSYVGLDMYLYRNTGTFGSPTWTLVDNVQDLKKASKRAEATLKSRASDEEKTEPTIRSREFTWGMITDETDTNYTALRTNHEARTSVELAFANGLIATSGTTYTRVTCKVTQFDEDEPLEEGIGAQVVAKPCKSSNASSRTTV